MGHIRRPGIERYLPHAFVVTLCVAVLPVIGAVVLGGGSVLATTIAMLVSLGLTHMGAALWQYHPGSEDVVFGDLMLWTYLRRLHAPRDISRRVQRLGLDTIGGDATERTPDQQMRLLKRLAASLEAGDPYTHGHSQRVSRHAVMIGRAMRLPRRQRAKIRVAGLLHDIGKLYVPSEVLNKPGKLTDEEFDLIKRHAALGGEIVARLGDPELTSIVRHHHERIDGTGYPDKRAGADIPLGARILSVADTFDALTSRRAYRPAQKHRVAIEILRKEAGKQLDADVVKAFLSYYSGRRSISRWTFMSNGASHAVNALVVWGQRAGLSGIANAAVAGSTAVALSASPIVSSSMMKRDPDRGRAVQASSQGPGTNDTVLGSGSGATRASAPAGPEVRAKRAGNRGNGAGKPDEAGTGKPKKEKKDKEDPEQASENAGPGNNSGGESPGGSSNGGSSGSGDTTTTDKGSGKPDKPKTSTGNTKDDAAAEGSTTTIDPTGPADPSDPTETVDAPGNGKGSGKGSSKDKTADDPVAETDPATIDDTTAPGNENGTGSGKGPKATL